MQAGQCDRAALEQSFGHIKRLRDVFALALTKNGDAAAQAMETVGDVDVQGPWACPIDRSVSTNGRHPFVALRPCGHVLQVLGLTRSARNQREASAGFLPQPSAGGADGRLCGHARLARPRRGCDRDSCVVGALRPARLKP